jgi:Uma2 family endonuclease
MTLAALDIEKLLPATFTHPGLSEADFLAWCAQFPDQTLEYTADGTVIVMPPTDRKTSARVVNILLQLGNWAERIGRGVVTGPDGGYRLPDGSRKSPDAAWYDASRHSDAEKSGEVFPVLAPEFVIEVRSPSDRPRLLREKMQDYIANGVQLGWLIDPLERTVEIYRPDQAPEVLTNPPSVSGEGPVAGFALTLDRIFTA